MSKGSHATWGGWESRTCEGCGEPIRLSGKSDAKHGGAMFRALPVPRSRHANCKWKPKQ